MKKIAHLTSAHQRFDTRIFIKECCSLSHSYSTFFIVADGLGNEFKDNVKIIDAGEFKGRKERMFNAPKAILKEALKLDADVFHLHDPELIPIGLKLKKKGKKVIFDAHEDLPNQILSKHYLNVYTRKAISFLASIYECYSCSKFDGVIAATPFIRDKFLNINENTVDINNYPKIEEFEVNSSIFKINNQICYVGGLAAVRGIEEMVEALPLTKNRTKLKIAGNFEDPILEDFVRLMPGWNNVDFLGYIGRKDIQKTLTESICGLVVLHPTKSYIDALPVKMFEYMAAGIPIIASNFPLWKKIIEDNSCGICVNPLDAKDIALAVDYLMSHNQEAIQMGLNGKKAVYEKYNWKNEEEKLIKFYQNILNS